MKRWIPRPALKDPYYQPSSAELLLLENKCCIEFFFNLHHNSLPLFTFFCSKLTCFSQTLGKVIARQGQKILLQRAMLFSPIPEGGHHSLKICLEFRFNIPEFSPPTALANIFATCYAATQTLLKVRRGQCSCTRQ